MQESTRDALKAATDARTAVTQPHNARMAQTPGFGGVDGFHAALAEADKRAGLGLAVTRAAARDARRALADLERVLSEPAADPKPKAKRS